MRFTTFATAVVLAIAALSACSSNVGVSGGPPSGFSASVAGTPCTPSVQAEGCLLGAGAQSRMECTATGWVLLEVCGGGTVCVEQPQPGAPARKITQCQMSGSGSDTISGADGTASDANTGSDAITEVGGGTDASDDETGGASQDADAYSGGTDAGSYDSWTGYDGESYDGGSYDQYVGYDASEYDASYYDSNPYDSTSYDSYYGDSNSYDSYNEDSASYDGYYNDSGYYGDGSSDGGYYDSGYSDTYDGDAFNYYDTNDVNYADGGSACGNGLCDFGETPKSCYKDCAGYGCEGHCGSKSADPGEVTCYCDGACTQSGDCCADFKAFCAP